MNSAPVQAICTKTEKIYPHRKVCEAVDGANTASEMTYQYEKVGASVQKRDEKEQK